ncbi:MAG: hypothetical protein JWO00_551, partial [Candidatus Parcubacteria bacterium]|nr:hypothetical protein [Candidatus Parcubacteria bacterium]
MESIVPVAYAAVDRKALETTLNPIYANIINPLIIAAFAFAVLVFVYGVIQMIINQ